MKNLPNFFCLPFVFCLSLLLPLSSLLLAQEFDDREYRALAQRKPIVDYYETVNDKSFYQLKRIHGMKGELNSYSEKLHNLQDRFDKIFYGLSSKGNFQTPFDTTMQPVRPVVKPRTPAVMPKMEAPTQITPRYQEPVEQAPPENQLAFNVDSPGKFSRDDQRVSTFSPDREGGLGYYFLFKPGVAIPYDIHKSNHSYKRFDPGFSAILSGGFKIKNFKVGLGGGYKNHSFHDTSKLRSPDRPLTGGSETFAGYLDLEYTLPIANAWEAYFGLGFGYHLTLIDDNQDLSTRKEHDIFFTGSTGVNWKMSELFALSLGYRYFHENEVPAHIIELGANFDF